MTCHWRLSKGGLIGSLGHSPRLAKKSWALSLPMQGSNISSYAKIIQLQINMLEKHNHLLTGMLVLKFSNSMAKLKVKPPRKSISVKMAVFMLIPSRPDRDCNVVFPVSIFFQFVARINWSRQWSTILLLVTCKNCPLSISHTWN